MSALARDAENRNNRIRFRGPLLSNSSIGAARRCQRATTNPPVAVPQTPDEPSRERVANAARRQAATARTSSRSTCPRSRREGAFGVAPTANPPVNRRVAHGRKFRPQAGARAGDVSPLDRERRDDRNDERRAENQLAQRLALGRVDRPQRAFDLLRRRPSSVHFRHDLRPPSAFRVASSTHNAAASADESQSPPCTSRDCGARLRPANGSA